MASAGRTRGSGPRGPADRGRRGCAVSGALLSPAPVADSRLCDNADREASTSLEAVTATLRIDSAHHASKPNLEPTHPHAAVLPGSRRRRWDCLFDWHRRDTCCTPTASQPARRTVNLGEVRLLVRDPDRPERRSTRQRASQPVRQVFREYWFEARVPLGMFRPVLFPPHINPGSEGGHRPKPSTARIGRGAFAAMNASTSSGARSSGLDGEEVDPSSANLSEMFETHHARVLANDVRIVEGPEPGRCQHQRQRRRDA